MSSYYSSSIYNNPSSPMGPAVVGSDKLEEEFALAVKKALAPDDSAPKQKHVRSVILYTWELKSSGSLWTALRTFPMMSDEVIVYKTLILIHKVIRQGHPNVLKESHKQIPWIDSLARLGSTGMPMGGRGFDQLILGYISYLKSKLLFHQERPYFSGTFDYEEYVSLRGVDDPNEGYETIDALLSLLDKMDTFQKIIFANLRAGGASEGKVAALVPLVEESYGIYQFIYSMMMAMHQIIGSVEVLGPLRDHFKRKHYSLVQFYDDCSQIRYLTSLITVPKLSHEAPDFLSQGPPTKQPKSKSKSDEDAQATRLQQQLLEEQEAMERQRQADLLRQQQEADLERQRQMELQRQQALLRQQQEQERMRLQMQFQEGQLAQSKLLDAQSQLDFFRQQQQRDAALVQDYSNKVMQLESQLANMTLQQTASSGKDDHIKKLQEEVASWKQKYEALAKLYAQLRKEHLDLLTKFKSTKDAGTKIADEARRESERLKAELKIKSNELTEVLVERNRLRGDADRIRLQYEEDLARLKREVEQNKVSLAEMSQSKGAEVQSLVQRFNTEQAQLEAIIASKQQQMEELRREMDQIRLSYEKYKAEQDEEKAVLQAGLDQALLVLADYQKQSQQGLSTKDDRIAVLEAQHRQLLYQMMDNVLQACSNTVSEAIFELDSAANVGNQNASPEYVLSLVEKSQFVCNEFASSFIKLANGGDPKDAITIANAFSQCVSQLTQNAKGVTRLAAEDHDAEDILNAARSSARATIDFFDAVRYARLNSADQKPEYIVGVSRETQHRIGQVTSTVEKLVSASNARDKNEDLGDIVEREMHNAALAIQEAAKRLQDLMHQQKDLNVHSAILQAAIAITTAIANLIKCATASQQEIVAQGRGSTSKTAFYKKNNKWTEGLISAAQSVAVATTYLVEIADGLVSGTRSWEQLVVAAQEVSVATTQLVAASRVKAVAFSKTQDKLEAAAVAVRDATKLLVKAAKEASQVSAQQKVQQELATMNSHEVKIKEMEQQVRILELEKELQTARYRLGEMRKQGYRQDDD